MTTVDVAVQDKVTHQGWWLRSPVPAALAIGWLSGIAALALPWVGLELSPSLRAWSLPLSWPPLPQSSWLNYGDAILLLLVVSVISSARHGWARSPLTRLCGAALVVLTLAFVATSRLEVGSVMQHVSQDASDVQLVNSEGVTGLSATATSFFGFNLDKTTLLFLSSLRPGAYLSIACGLALAGHRRLARPPVTAMVLSCAAALLLACTLTVGVVAQEDKLNGEAALAIGDPRLALARMADAVALSPVLGSDPQVEATVGQADDELGVRTAAGYYAYAVLQPESNAEDVYRDLSLLRRAVAMSPGSVAIAQQLTQSLVLAANHGDVALVHDTVPGASALAVLLAVGRAEYELGDYWAAYQRYAQALAGTSNSEVRSYELTYMALSSDHIGNTAEFRRLIVEAVSADGNDRNTVARDAATGLFVTPGV